MKKLLLTTLSLLNLTSFAGSVELSGDLTVSFFNGINRTSTGVSGMVFPQILMKDRMSLGFDFGIEFVERFMSEAHAAYTLPDSLINPAYDSVSVQFKDYSDFMFLPISLIFRWDLGDPGDLGRIYPSLFLGAGMILNLEQRSQRLYIDYYYPSGTIYRPYPYESGGKSHSTVDFYLKPKISVYYNRIYLSYEHYINTEYMVGSVSVGYIFSL